MKEMFELVPTLSWRWPWPERERRRNRGDVADGKPFTAIR
jgi:hypothetical protein